MSLFRAIILLLAATAAGTIIPSFSYGQNVVEDSVELSINGRAAKANELYFEALKSIMHDDNNQAEAQLQQFLEIEPDVSAAYYELSKISYSERKNDKAEEYIKKALALDPENKWYKEEYASLLADRGAFEEAANTVAGLAEANPDDKNYRMVAAEYFEKAKKYKEALAWINKALASDSTDEDVLQQKVHIYLSMNDVEKAAGVIKQIIASDPRNGKYYKWLGDLYDNNKLPQKAAEVYEQAQKIVPGDADVQSGIAEHYLNTGDTAGYINAIKKAIINKDNDADVQMDMLEKLIQVLPSDSAMSSEGLPVLQQLIVQHPNDPQVLTAYGNFLALSDQPDSAAVMYKRALAISAGKFDDWRYLLNVYSDRKYADSLIRYSEKAMRLFPNVAMVSYYNAIGHSNKREYASAINAVKRAIDLQPENDKPALTAMYELLAETYHNNKQDDLSDKAYDKTLQLDPDNAVALNNYAYYLSERGARLDDAEKMSQKSLQLKPDEATFLDTYGWIEYKKGNYLKAKDYVEQAIKQSGDKADATLYDHLGNICYQLNEKSKALEYWKMAKEKGGDDPLIDKKISEGKLYE